MSDHMTFPDTVEEFMEQYKVVDTDHVYTNGVEFIPIFRMKQWFEHLPPAQPEIIRCKECEHRPKATRADEKVFHGFSVEFPDEKCPCHCEDGWYGWYPDDDFYCGYAERRTNG